MKPLVQGVPWTVPLGDGHAFGIKPQASPKAGRLGAARRTTRKFHPLGMPRRTMEN